MATMLDLIANAETAFDAAQTELDISANRLDELRRRVDSGDKSVRNSDVDEAIRKHSRAKSVADQASKKLAEYRADHAADLEVTRMQNETRPVVKERAGSDVHHGDTRTGYLDVRTAVRSARPSGGEFSTRAFLAAGSTATAAVVLETSPVSMGKPATGLLDVLPARTVEGAEYSYLRQTTRTNNAAPVAVAATKPTSVYTLTRISGTLNVVAHLSEAIHELWLEDDRNLQTFIETELAWGIGSALENQILNGTGTAPSLNGIVATATGTQAYATSPAVTIRTAISQLEGAGLVPSGIVMAAADWLAIETEVSALSGHYLLGQIAGAPLDSVRRTLWGVPVVLSTSHSAGTAVVLSENSAGLVTDGSIQLQWGRIDSDFAENNVRARAEVRAEVEVYRPSGIIVATLTSGT